jgi:hypothetical protein
VFDVCTFNTFQAKIACETFGVSTHQLAGKGNFSAGFKLLKPLNFRKKEKYIMTVMLKVCMYVCMYVPVCMMYVCKTDLFYL